MSYDGVEIPSVSEQVFGKWCYHKFEPMKGRGWPCHFKCPKCDSTITSVIPGYGNSYRYEKCCKCDQKLFLGLSKKGYGPDSYDEFMIVTRVYKKLFEMLQEEDGFLDPRSHPDYDLNHDSDPQGNYEAFTKQIAIARNRSMLSRFKDGNTPIIL